MEIGALRRTFTLGAILLGGCAVGVGADEQEAPLDDGDSRPPVATDSGKADGVGASRTACLQCLQYGGGAGCGPRCTFSDSCAEAVEGGCAAGKETTLQQCLDACSPCGGSCGSGAYDSGAYTACTCDPSDPCGWSNDGYCDSQCKTKFGTMFDDGDDCGGSSGGGTDAYDATLGNQFAVAAQSGAAGYSMGRCYEYVWSALRSVLGWQIESLPIPATSAYQFGEWVIQNPTRARAELHLARVFTSAASAPRGSVIVWPPGVCGYNATHGHIEISLGNGTACSDFCGAIAGCTAQVFMPVP